MRRMCLGLVAMLGIAAASQAGVIAIGKTEFAPYSSLVTFTGIPINTPVNGLVASGLTFGVTSNGVPTTGVRIRPGGPGTTNDTNPPMIDGTPIPPNMVLSVLFPRLMTEFGYGYAALAFGDLQNATTINLFAGSDLVGTLSYNAGPNPSFPGGFAGIRSTIPFDRATITFRQPPVAAFVVDNIRFTQAVPEPLSVAVFGGLVAVGGLVARRRAANVAV